MSVRDSGHLTERCLDVVVRLLSTFEEKNAVTDIKGRIGFVDAMGLQKANPTRLPQGKEPDDPNSPLLEARLHSTVVKRVAATVASSHCMAIFTATLLTFACVR